MLVRLKSKTLFSASWFNMRAAKAIIVLVSTNYVPIGWSRFSIMPTWQCLSITDEQACEII